MTDKAAQGAEIESAEALLDLIENLDIGWEQQQSGSDYLIKIRAIEAFAARAREQALSDVEQIIEKHDGHDSAQCWAYIASEIGLLRSHASSATREKQ